MGKISKIKIKVEEINLENQDALIGFGGDILITDLLYGKIKGKPPEHMFSGLHDMLEKCDLVFANLETPITETNEKNPKKSSDLPFLKISPDVAESFKHAPFHLFQLANNHMLDFGSQGLRDTINHLDKANINYVGVGENLNDARKHFVAKIKGITVGILAYSNTYYATEREPGCAPLREDIILQDIEKIRGQVDVLVVSLHHGVVYCDYPIQEHIALSRKLVDTGANIVIGHHPHVIQGMEIYNSGLIAYSLNALIFDWPESELIHKLKNSPLVKEGVMAFDPHDSRTRESLFLLLGIKGSMVTAQFVPIFQDHQQIPVVAQGDDEKRILARLNQLSEAIHQDELHVWDKLDRLNSIENMAGIYEDGLWMNLKKINRIRFRHFKYLYHYICSKFLC